jgi:hypothetical protein
MTNIADVILEIQTEIAKISGIQQAPQYPPDKLTEYPFAVCYPDNGRITTETKGATKGLHNIVIEIHLARKLLNETVKKAIQYIDLVPEELFSSLFNSEFTPTKFQTFGAVRYEFVAMEWNGVDTLGLRFVMEDVKVKKSL